MSLVNYIIEGKKASWILSGIFAIFMFVSVVFTHYNLFHGFYISALWKQPSLFWGFWLPKICISLFFAFFILITKRKWWTVVIFILCNIWAIANIVYQRANNYVMTWDTIMMVSNLDGFLSSIGFYWNWQCWCLIGLTMLYAIIVPFFRLEWVNKYAIFLVASILCVTYIIGADCCRKHMSADTLTDCGTPKNLIPFTIPQEIRHKIWRSEGYYMEMHSMPAYLITMLNNAIVDGITQPTVTFDDKDMEMISHLIRPNDTTITPSYNIMFVLMESLETFALEAKDSYGNYYMSQIHALLDDTNTLYVDKITSQVRHGVSADGQMILTTGMLPIQNGTAAMKYGRNVYPNYAHFYETSLLSNPFYATTWNQNVVTYSYGFDRMLGGAGVLTDAETFAMIQSSLSENIARPYCYCAITVSAHSPFDRVPYNQSLNFDDAMPSTMKAYLTCQHYTDSCFGVWYSEWKDTDLAKNTVLVITGDHTVFKDAMLQEFQSYSQQAGLSIASGKTYCPLIIQAPQIDENMQITDVCYQMDVYPTIMHLIGCESYFWKGFGVNLFDSIARHNRSVREEWAYHLSDKMIRMDYFRGVQQK